MYHPTKLGLLIALLLISTNLAGCAPGTDVTSEVPTHTPEPTPAEALADLEGMLWKLDSRVNSQSESVDVVSNTEITIEFKADEISGNAGCNTYFASYEVEGNSLTIGQIGSTMMACESEVNEQETQYLAALESVATYQIKGNTLELFDAGGMRLALYTAETEAGMPNPASVYCEEQDGTVEIRTEEGGEVGYCVFPDGSECEEWAFFRGECTPEGSSSLTPEALENGVYQSEWPEDGVAQLTDGEYRKSIVEGSATELIIRLTDIAFGDLDGDGVQDAAVILVTDPGGSGTFYDLAAVLNRNGKPEHVATVFLGDRAEIRAFSIETGQVIIEMVTHGPDDPMCCPTQIVRNIYALEGDTLVEMASEVIGSVEETSEAEIPAELLGTVWQWSSLVETEPAAQSVVPHPENYTLVFQPDGALDIQADCNEVRGSYIQEGNALTIELGPSTMAYCGEQSSDQQYLDLLGRVSSYTVENERLVLNLEDGAGKMMFDRA